VKNRILVPFEGADFGSAGLTWGQWDIWPAMQEEQASFSVGSYLRLAPGRTVQDVADDLRFLASRHQALRTRLGFDGDGQARQEVADSGELELAVVDAGGEDPLTVAADLHARYDAHVFDETREWPVRWAVVLAGGEPAYLVSVISHLTVDGPAVMTMLNELAARDPVTGAAAGPVTGLAPLELARWQAGPAAQRTSDLALRRWEKLLRVIPAQRFARPPGPRPPDPEAPPYWQVIYHTPAGHLAARAVAARTGVSTSTVLLAAFAVVMSRVTGISPAVVQMIMSNRYRRELAGTVSPLCMSVPVIIDVPAVGQLSDVTVAEFDAVVRHAWRRSIGAYKLSYYDPRQKDELVARIGAERGETIDLQCYVNDRRSVTPEAPVTEAPTAAQIQAALERSELTWGFRKVIPGATAFMHVNNVPGTLHYELCADTRYVPPADMEAWVRGLEELLVAVSR
jgi:hypothetical protein